MLVSRELPARIPPAPFAVGESCQGHTDPNRTTVRRWFAYREAGFATIPLIPRSKTPALGSPHPWGCPEYRTCHGACGRLGRGYYDAMATRRSTSTIRLRRDARRGCAEIPRYTGSSTAW